MKSIFTQVINRGEYDLTSLLAKIDSYHIEGKLTDAEREELYNAARKEPQAQYNFAIEIEKLWEAIRALQNNGGNSEATVEEFKQPTGAHNAYNPGDKVIYNGVVYTCLLANCVWSPAALPSAWGVE